MAGRAFAVTFESMEPSVAVVTVSGEVDMATAPDFEAALENAVREQDAAALLVDLTGVSFIDSTGLTALVHALERQRWSGGTLAIVSDDRRVATLLEVSRLDRVLRRFPTREAAVASLPGAEEPHGGAG
jgi:anti-sigma B factor antagonist